MDLQDPLDLLEKEEIEVKLDHKVLKVNQAPEVNQEHQENKEKMVVLVNQVLKEVKVTEVMSVFKVFLDHRDQLVKKEFQELLDHQVLQVNQGKKDLLAEMEELDNKESWDHLVHVVHQEKKVNLVHQELQVQPVHQAHQVNPWVMMQQRLQLYLDKDKVKDQIHCKVMILIFLQEYLAKRLQMMIVRS